MEPKVVELGRVRADECYQGVELAGILHVGNFLGRALLQKGEEGSSHPVDAEDIDSEALLEIIPGWLLQPIDPLAD
jgi:hypothetical protein